MGKPDLHPQLKVRKLSQEYNILWLQMYTTRLIQYKQYEQQYVPGHVIWWAGRVIPRGHAGVHAVGALQTQGVIGLLSGWRGLVVQDGVVN